MTSIIKRPGFSDRFDRKKKRFALAYPDEARFLQSPDLNELQSLQDDKLRRVAEYVLQDGRKVSGDDPVVAEIEGDPTKVVVTLPTASIYVAGLVHDVASATYQLPMTGEVSIGVRVTETLEDHVSNPELRGDIEGTEAYMEPGAARVRMDVSWGHSLDQNGQPLIPVYTMRDGTILTNETNIDLSEIYKAIEGYSRESNGSFVHSGCLVAALGLTGEGKQQFTISEGVAYVNGRRIPRNQAIRFEQAEEPDLREVSAEPHAWTAATGGTQTIRLSKAPIAAVQRVTVVKRATETVTHGAFSGVSDPLAHSSVEAIISIKQGATTYTSPADYLISQGEIDWSPSGAEPNPGSNYEVDYRYYENVQPDAVTRDTITVSGAVNPSNVLVDYAYKLPRTDTIAIDMSGNILYLKGVSAISRPQPPRVPTTQLELARVINRWGIPPEIIQSAVRNMSYAAITSLRAAVIDLYDLVAQERLRSDISGREVAAKRGVFVDPFLDDDMRDQGIPQSGACSAGFLRLPIAARVHDFPTLRTVQTIEFADEVIISQLRETGEMKINPYMTFTRIPGRASLEPSLDIWTDTEQVWTSPTTARFDIPGETGSRGTLTSIELDANVEVIRTTTRDAEFIRPREINFRLEGFIENETVTSAAFDSVPVTVSAAPADPDGVIVGTFTIPANVPQGTKRVTFEGSVGTQASSSYTGRGTITVEELRLVTALNGTVEDLPGPVAEAPAVVNHQSAIDRLRASRRGPWGGTDTMRCGVDPLAQTFMLTEGRCVTAIRLKCKTKGSSKAVFVQIRTVEVGLPTSTVLAEAFVPGTDLAPETFFTARFTTPVYLEPGREYAFVVLTDDDSHSLGIAQLGKIDQNNTLVSEQPFVIGVLLSSSNAMTWTVHNEADLVFQLIGCRFAPEARTIPIGSFVATKMSDIIVWAGVEYPESEASVEIVLTWNDGQKIETITAAPEQRIRLDRYIENQTVQVSARLKGTSRVTPFLFPGVQIVEGEMATTADYVTRAVNAEEADRVTVTFDAFVPAGASVTVEIGEVGEFQTVGVHSATPLGDGLVEQTYQRTPYAPLDARTKITLTGIPGARPEISKLRMITTDI
jgi:hypothetical protein